MFFIANKQKMLIIGDDPSLQRLLHARREGHENVKIIKAINGKNGFIQASLHNPDLIIQDWMLSDIQGSEVFDRLKCERKTKNTSVLMLTGCNEIGNIEGDFYRGADAYLTKTASLQILGKKVDEMLSSSRSH